MKTFLFSAEGRIGRGSYWKGVLLSTIVIAAAAGILNLIFAQFIPNEAAGSGEFKVDGAKALPFAVVSLGALVLQVWIAICLGIKRFHDRDKPGVWVLIGLVPFIGAIWFLVEAGFLKGTAGPNRFGPDPLAGHLAAPAGLSPAV